MKRFLPLISWCIASILALLVFISLKFSDSEKNGPAIKNDVAVLPSGEGENLLEKKHFEILGEQYSLSWNFIDGENMVVWEHFPIDGFISMDVFWNAKYSFRENDGLLFIKRISLNMDEEKSDSAAVTDFLTRIVVQKLSETFSSINVDGKKNLGDIVKKRIESYVMDNLFEIEEFKISVSDGGLLFDCVDENKGIFSYRKCFSFDDGTGSVCIEDNKIFIDDGREEDRHFYGGVLNFGKEKFSSLLYSFERNKNTGAVNVVPVGLVYGKITESDKVSEIQTVQNCLKFLKAPESLSWVVKKELCVDKALYHNLRWMTRCDLEN